ncbi:MAG: RNA polymerase sigma factor [Intrasporangiaceae bacterium]|nr:RNA polymerase sigma factor [Intrasporangiaceae bacterium]
MTDAAGVLGDNADDLLRYFRRRVPAQDAADLLAETLMTAWRRNRLLPNEPDQARAWLFGIAHHVLLNHRRGERRRHALADRLRLALSEQPGAGADDGLEVRDAIERLDPRLAEIVRLVHWEGFTLAQVAAVVELPASTVRNHYQLAKAELRNMLLEPTRTSAARPSPV